MPAGGVARAPAGRPAERRRSHRGVGWLVSAALFIAVLGVLNVIYGIAAISRSTFHMKDAPYLVGDLEA